MVKLHLFFPSCEIFMRWLGRDPVVFLREEDATTRCPLLALLTILNACMRFDTSTNPICENHVVRILLTSLASNSPISSGPPFPAMPPCLLIYPRPPVVLSLSLRNSSRPAMLLDFLFFSLLSSPPLISHTSPLPSLLTMQNTHSL